MNKNDKIRQSFLETRNRRKTQRCVVYTIKLVQNKLNKKQQEQLKMLFVESKWLANDILNFSENQPINDYKITNFVNYKNKDGSFETKELKYIGSQMKQSVYTDIIGNIKGLKKLKDHNHKVGKIKYKSDYKSINLKQFGVTYKIIDKNNVKIQNINGNLYTKGLKQIPNDVEFANAKLLNTPKGYYLAITCYKKKEELIPSINESIGIDMGIKNSLIMSNGKIINISIQETDKLKKLQNQLLRKKKGSKNRYKIIHKIQAEYQHINNKKRDITNKIFAELNQYQHVIIQDEMLTKWKETYFGKQIQHSILGRIKSKIVEASKSNKKYIVISKKYKTTQMCCECGNIQPMKLSDRTYECPICDNIIDRDINSAKNILKIGLERIELKPVESKSVKQEATKSLV